MATTNSRTVDLLVEAFDLNQRRKFTLSLGEDRHLDLYFRPITRADRKRAQAAATNSEDALDVSTQMLCLIAELEDGSRAFSIGDAAKLQNELPETVLNDLELFLFGVGEPEDMATAKNA